MNNTNIEKPSGPKARRAIDRYVKQMITVDPITMSSSIYTSKTRSSSAVDKSNRHKNYSEDTAYSDRGSRYNEIDNDEEDYERAEDLHHIPIRKVKVLDQSFSEDDQNNLTNIFNDNSCSYLIWSTAIIGLFAIYVMISYTLASNNIENKRTIEDEVRNIKRQFPSQDLDTWPKLVSGIRSVIDDLPTRPSVFLFLNLDQNDDTISHKIASEVANIAARQLNSNDPIILNPETLNKQKNGVLLEVYKKILEQRKVMLITNVHEVNAEVAKAFHYFCDRENPMVKDSIIIFTLNADSNSSEDPLKLAEDTLFDIWSPPLADNLIRPLITRLTSYVLPITTEK